MKLSQIHYAVEVAKCQSFTEAARKLYITQPTLSQQIRQLEQDIGTQLFTRNTRQVTLTRAGKEFLEYAVPIIENMNRLEISMQKYTSPIKGQLRIGLLWSFAYLNIDKMLNDFSQFYPDIEITFVIDGSLSLMERFQAHELDLLFINVYGQEFKSAYQYYMISEDPLCAIISRRHPLSTKPEIHASDLKRENLLLPAENTSIGKDIQTLLKKYLPDIHVLGKSNQVDVCLQTAAANLGISFASRSVVYEKNFKDLPILAIPLYPPILRRTYLVCSKKSRQNPLVNTFTKYATNYYHSLQTDK